MLVVLDTNVVASGFLFGGHPATILFAFARGKFNVVATPEILWEYEATLRKLGKKQPQDVEQWLFFLNDRVRLTMPSNLIAVCRDPDDDKFLSCAVSANAAWIVSGDKDLLALKVVEGVPIVKPADFIKANRGLFKA